MWGGRRQRGWIKCTVGGIACDKAASCGKTPFFQVCDVRSMYRQPLSQRHGFWQEEGGVTRWGGSADCQASVRRRRRRHCGGKKARSPEGSCDCEESFLQTSHTSSLQRFRSHSPRCRLLYTFSRYVNRFGEDLM